MAKLHFFYSTMNAGKSTSLLQANHNYKEAGLETMVFIPKEMEAFSDGKIVSRIGLEKKAIIADKNLNFLQYIKDNKTKNLACVLIDEAQFLTKQQIMQLGEVADTMSFPVLCYGIRTDFKGELFEGSSTLLALADNLIELDRSIHISKVTTDSNGFYQSGKNPIQGEEIPIHTRPKPLQRLRPRLLRPIW